LEGRTSSAPGGGGGQEGGKRRAWLEVESLGRVAVQVAGALKAGAAVTLSLRPERIHVSTSQVSDLDNRLPGVVERAIFLGSDIHYHVRLTGGRMLKAQTIFSPLRRVRREGDRVYLQWRAEDACVVLE
ncbi:MAG: TOBE domain-containing protein, partial [Elusimicrobiota bacterium]